MTVCQGCISHHANCFACITIQALGIIVISVLVATVDTHFLYPSVVGLGVTAGVLLVLACPSVIVVVSYGKFQWMKKVGRNP